MDKLADILRTAGVDASTLDLIFQADMEAIHRLTVPGAQAVETWEKLRGLVPQTGCWPVLLGDDQALQALQDQLKHLRYPRAVRILEEAAAIDPSEWFRNRLLDEIDEIERCLEEAEDAGRRSYYENLLAADGPFRGMPQGPWPDDVQPADDFYTPYTPIRRKPQPRVHVGLVSTPLSWQVPAFLRYGSWNECPSAAEHVALFKFWGEEYGAEIVSMAYDVVEMKVARPPTDRDGALALAAQQYLYCQDIVDQGTQTLQRLAATLLGGAIWFFWWD
jgi:Domain of unknown function (DUF4253)